MGAALTARRQKPAAAKPRAGFGPRAHILGARTPPNPAILPPMDDTPADTARARQERRLDEALKETFPASDPVSIQHIGGTAATLSPVQARQRLARRRLRGLVDQHRNLAQS